MNKLAGNNPYTNAPLIMVVIDVQFSDIPNFNNKFDYEGLAESLFPLGFTEKVKVNQNGFEIEVKNNQETEDNASNFNTRNVSSSHWVYQNTQKTIALHVLKNKIIYKTTDYRCFNEFKKTFESCLVACQSSIELLKDMPIKRVGARYVDVIVPKLNQNVELYLKNEWHAPKTFINNSSNRKLMMNRTTQFFEDGEATVKVDSTQFEPSNGMPISIIPDDLTDQQEASLKLKFLPWIEESMHNKKSYVVLDVDAFTTNELGLIDSVIEKITNLRSVVRNTFDAYISENAEIEWNNKYE